MKVIRKSDGKMVVSEGKLVHTFPKGQTIGVQLMKRYYHLQPHQATYSSIQRASEHDRQVFLLEGTTSHYLIVPHRLDLYDYKE